MENKKQTSKGGRPRGRSKVLSEHQNSIRAKKNDDKHYLEIFQKLLDESPLVSDTAKRQLAATVVDCARHLDDLKVRNDNGTIASDERKAVSSLMGRRQSAIVALGLLVIPDRDDLDEDDAT